MNLVDNNTPYDILDKKERFKELKKQILDIENCFKSCSLTGLENRVWYIFYQRYWKKKTKTELAKQLRCTPNQISLVIEKTIRRLRRPPRVRALEDYGLSPEIDPIREKAYLDYIRREKQNATTAASN